MGKKWWEGGKGVEREGRKEVEEGEKRWGVGLFFCELKDLMVVVLVGGRLIWGLVGE